MTAARGPDRSELVVAAVLGVLGVGLAALAAWALVIGDFMPGLGFGGMAAMLGLGVFILLRVKARDMTPMERTAWQDRRDRDRLESVDHGGVEWSTGGSSDSASSSSSGDGGSSGHSETGRSD